jgi:parvulin-like peptidyl-prolyl isomerase
MRSLLREPLLHFVVIGAALFLVWPFIADRVAPASKQIVISQGQMQRAIEIFYKTHLRPLTPRDLDELAEEEIETEVYYREGVALGVDRDDEIIRRRIAQKLQFMTQDTVDQEVPSEADLQQFLDTHRGDFGGEPQIAFSQVYLNPDRHGDVLGRDALRLLAHLRAADGRLNYGADSDVLPLPNDFEATPVHVISSMFGEDFAATLAAQPPGRWVGPVRSGYGLHLVLVREKRQASQPQLQQVRDAVLREWQSARRTEANREAYRLMRAKYLVKVEIPPAIQTAAAGLEVDR